MFNFGSLLQLAGTLLAPKPGVDEDHDESSSEVEVEDSPEVSIVKVGAWVGTSGLRSAKSARDAVKFASSVGLKRLDVIVNDHSAAREAREFTTFPPSSIIRLADEANGAGLDVHLMTWAQPDGEYLRRCCAAMLSLHDMCAAKSIQFDLEEPWVLYRGQADYIAAAKLVRSRLEDIVVGVNAIGYTPVAKVGPMLERADYVVPQCYSTRTSGMDPSTCVPKLVNLWGRRFKTRRTVVGLAAYGQSGIRGYTAESAMRAAFGAAAAVRGVDEVVYWSLAHMRKDAAVTAAVHALTGV